MMHEEEGAQGGIRKVHKPTWFKWISLMELQNSFSEVLVKTVALSVKFPSRLFSDSWQGLRNPKKRGGNVSKIDF